MSSGSKIKPHFGYDKTTPQHIIVEDLQFRLLSGTTLTTKHQKNYYLPFNYFTQQLRTTNQQMVSISEMS